MRSRKFSLYFNRSTQMQRLRAKMPLKRGCTARSIGRERVQADKKKNKNVLIILSCKKNNAENSIYDGKECSFRKGAYVEQLDIYFFSALVAQLVRACGC